MNDSTLKKIKELAEKGYSSRKIAKELGISRSTVYYYIRTLGVVKPVVIPVVKPPQNEEGKLQEELLKVVKPLLEEWYNQWLNHLEEVKEEIKRLQKEINEIREVVKPVIPDESCISLYNKDITTTKNNTTTNIQEDKEKKTRKTNEYYELVEWFGKLRGIPLDRGFINKNIRHSKNLIKQYGIGFVKSAILWRLQNDEDDFWKTTLFDLGTVYSNIAKWIAEAKINGEKRFMSLNEWIEKHKEYSWKEIKDRKARMKAYFRAVNLALKDKRVVLTEKEWETYGKVRNLLEKEVNGG